MPGIQIDWKAVYTRNWDEFGQPAATISLSHAGKGVPRGAGVHTSCSLKPFHLTDHIFVVKNILQPSSGPRADIDTQHVNIDSTIQIACLLLV